MFDAGLSWNVSFDGSSRDMDERREFKEIIDRREIWDIYSNSNLLKIRLNNIDYTIVFWVKI